MTGARGGIFDRVVARRADQVTDEAITAFMDGAPVIRTPHGLFHVVIVAAPAGAGKTHFVCTVAERAAARHAGDTAVIAIATPTNDQAYELVRRIAERVPDRTVAFVPANGIQLPAGTAAMPNVREAEAVRARFYPIVVGTLDKLGDAHARGTLGRFRYLVIDEAYQADSARYFGVAGDRRSAPARGRPRPTGPVHHDAGRRPLARPAGGSDADRGGGGPREPPGGPRLPAADHASAPAVGDPRGVGLLPGPPVRRVDVARRAVDDPDACGALGRQHGHGRGPGRGGSLRMGVRPAARVARADRGSPDRGRDHVGSPAA